MNQLASVLGGNVGVLPSVYLGMPLGAKSNSKHIWDSVLEKCEKKLTRWKAQYLSTGGRLTLINARCSTKTGQVQNGFFLAR